MNVRTIIVTISVFSALQIAMVVAGHYVPDIKSMFAVFGMGMSLASGIALGQVRRRAVLDSVLWGALGGGLSGLIGIALSFALSDVPATLMVFGTAGSAVAGAIGGGLSSLITLKQHPRGQTDGSGSSKSVGSLDR